MGSRITSQLGLSSANVITALTAALAEAAPGAADGNISLAGEPLFAVVAASDGAIIAASASVMASTQPPSDMTTAQDAPGPNSPDSTTTVFIAVGAVAGALVLVAAVLIGWRQRKPRQKTLMGPQLAESSSSGFDTTNPMQASTGPRLSASSLSGFDVANPVHRGDSSMQTQLEGRSAKGLASRAGVPPMQGNASGASLMAKRQPRAAAAPIRARER